MIPGIGTIIDVTVIAITGLAGLIVGKKLSSTIRKTLFNVLGLMALVTGIKMAVEGGQLFMALISLIAGVILGELFSLEKKMTAISEKSKSPGFMNALVMASVLSLVGPLAILGPMNEGLGKGLDLLLLKAGFDGISTVLLAATMGVGVVFSAIPVFLVQSALTMIAMVNGGIISESILNGLTSVGGIMIIAVGLDLLEIKKISVTTMLPSLSIVPVILLMGRLLGGI